MTASPPRSLDDIRSRLRPAGDVPPADAGVLVPLYGEPGSWRLLFTRRREDLASHPGQISFPGGRVEPEDATTLETALREAREEVDIREEDADVLGGLADFETYRGDHLAAYVAAVAGEPPTEPADRGEVAEVFTVPLASFLDPDAYESRVHARDRRGTRVHYWHLPPGTVWGITGRLVAALLVDVAGWEPPGEPRVVDARDGFDP